LGVEEREIKEKNPDDAHLLCTADDIQAGIMFWPSMVGYVMNF